MQAMTIEAMPNNRKYTVDISSGRTQNYVFRQKSVTVLNRTGIQTF